jgi:hypothetical protein
MKPSLALLPTPSNKEAMGFKEVVEATPNLQGEWKAGLGALRAEDRPHVKPEDTSTTRLRGSVDIDTAWLPLDRHGNRWDFAIGYQHANRSDEFIYWVETHTGSDGNIKVMLKKLAWLKTWLGAEGKGLAKFDRLFVWAPSGATSFTKGALQVKILAEKGLYYSGKALRISVNHEIAKPR